MSDALESLDAEDSSPGKPSPAQARKFLAERDPVKESQERAARWEALIPDGVSGKLRADLESTLDLAHYALGLPVNKLAQDIVRESNAMAEKQGLEPDDPKVARATALKMVKTIEAAALSQNPFADAPPSLEKYVNQMSAYARTLGWTPQQISLSLHSAMVQAKGDKTLAAGLFADQVFGEMPERGHRGDVSHDALGGDSERGSKKMSSDDVTPRLLPEDEPYAGDRLVTVYTARNDKNELDAYAIRAEDLRDEVMEREIRGRAADKMLETLDKVAATSLKPLDYAVYRIMRDEAYRIDANRDVDKPLTKVVQEQLQYDKVQGADLAIKRVKQHLAELGLKDVDELSDQAKKRLTMTTDQAVAEGVANKPKRSKQADLE